MRTKALMLLVPICALALGGCGSEPPAPPQAPTPPRAAAPVAPPEPVDPDFGMALDGGQKWQVDDHTRASGREMTALLDGTATIESVNDARALGRALNDEITNLIQGCTMTGPAHDELHVFLMELILRADGLGAGSDLAKLQQTRRELGQLFEAYERHFE